MPFVDEGWQEVYPDRLNRPPRQSLTQHVQPLEPIPNALPPTELTWLPHYPASLHRAGRVLSSPSSFRWPMVPIANTEWTPIYPSRIHRRRLPVAGMPAWFGVLGAQQVIAQRMFWLPQYPSLLRRVRPRSFSQRVVPPIQGGAVSPAIQGSTILSTATCVEWAEVDLERSLLAEEALSRAAMVCAVVGGEAFLLLEDGGFFLLEDGGKILLEDQTACEQEAIGRSMMVEEDVC